MRQLLLMMLVALCAAPAYAQDAAKVDPKHYKVEFENDQVRVLRINYAPGEKSVMHAHPGAVAVFLTDASARFTMPDGSTKDMAPKAGSFQWTDAGVHQPESTSDQPFEVLLVEVKGKAGKGK